MRAPNQLRYRDVLNELLRAPAAWRPALDFAETPEAYVARIDVPGVDPSDLAIEVEEDRLEVRGKRAAELREHGEGARRYERPHGEFVRALRLPGPVDRDRVTAAAKHGVLTLTLPKPEARQPRHIEIDVAD